MFCVGEVRSKLSEELDNMADLHLFPIGILCATDTSLGRWTTGGTGVNDFFEPNDGCTSQPVDTTLQSTFENHSIQAREKIPIYRSIQYSYKDIWHREYEMIERFYEHRKGKAHRFYVVDLSVRAIPTALTITVGTVSATIPDTHRFTTIAGKGGYYACCYKPSTASVLIGRMISLSADANITFAASWGDVGTFKAGETFVYPMVEVYFTSMQPKPKEFNPEIALDGGQMYDLEVGFIQYGCD